MADISTDTEELEPTETRQAPEPSRTAPLGNYSVGDLRDGNNAFTFVMDELHAISEGLNDLNQRVRSLEELQGVYGDVVADSVDAQELMVGGDSVRVLLDGKQAALTWMTNDEVDALWANSLAEALAG